MRILVIDEQAQAYKTLLDHLPHDIEYTHHADQAYECDILLASPAEAAQALEAGCQPRWIQSTWAGVDALLPYLKGRDVQLTGIKGIFGALMSEYVFAYILADLRSLQHFSSLQQQASWDDKVRPDTLVGKTITIVGTGSIGQQLAASARHFGMSTIGVNRSGQPEANFDQISTALSSAVRAAQYVVACLPDTRATRRLFDRECFQAMRDDAMFFNVGRGGCVDETALIDALEQRYIRQAVLDVFEQEPLPPGHPYWQLSNLTITPHIAAPSYPEDIAAVFLKNLTRFKQNQTLNHLIDPQKGY